MVNVVRYKGMKIDIRLKEEGHNRWHCHVSFQEHTLSLSLDDDPILLGCSKGTTKKHLKIAVNCVKDYLDELREKWSEYHG